jgi:flagellar basal-body rod protein FlgC
MSGTVFSALSGLAAYQKQLQVSANNVSNVGSVARLGEGEQNQPYVPQEVVQTSQEPAGTLADIRPIANPVLPVYQPESPLANADGVVNYPNVDLGEERVNQILANIAYKANLESIKAYRDAEQSLLDISG